MKIFQYVFTAALLSFSTLPTHAVIIGTDSFNYPDGPIAGRAGGRFWNYKNFTPTGYNGAASSWEALSNTPVISGGKLVTSLNAQVRRRYRGANEANEAEGAVNDSASVPSSVAKKVYYRVFVTTGPSVTPADYFGISSHDFGTEKIYFGKRGGSTTWGLEEVSGAGVNASAAFTIAPNTTYALVAIVDFTNDFIRLYVNPNLNGTEPGPGSAAASLTYNGTNWSSAVRFAAGTAVSWDDLVVATEWTDLAPILVTTAADEDNLSLGGGTGVSLREAVKYSPSGSLINFAPALSGQTLTLNHPDGDMEIPGSLTIDASALPGGIRLDGTNARRHFYVTGGLTLTGLTLTGGNGAGLDAGAGGAIYSEGSLTLTRCTLHGNSGNFGGAIFNNGGTATLTQCTITGNTAPAGGAIYNEGVLELTRCSISENFADVEGGAIRNIAQLTLRDTIVAGNSSPSGTDISNAVGLAATITTTGANLIGNISGSGLSAGLTVLVGEPKLTPLGNFGGPVQTMHPLIDSPAIDAGSTTHPGGTDARGFPRLIDGDASTLGQLDIGAVEAGPITFVATAADSLASTTLRTRIANAAGIPGARIAFLASAFTATITLGGAQLEIPATANGLFIDGSNLTAPITISGDSTSRVFNIVSGATVAMHSLKIVSGFGGFTALSGGGILNEGTCTLISSTISGNTASSGGGIANSGNISIHSSTVSGNSGQSGSGIFNSHFLTMDSSTVSGNTGGGFAENFGGGISNSGTCTVLRSTLSGNTADSGGGILSSSGTLRLASTIVAGNTGLSSNPNIGGVFTGNDNYIGDAPMLAPLGNYGGPTQTMPPLPGSPAIDSGAVSLARIDQRGFSRRRDGDGNGIAFPDIGAVEASIVLVTTLADSGTGSLRAALLEAATQPGADTITFLAHLSRGTILLADTFSFGDESNLTIDATNLPGGITLDGNNAVRHFYVNGGSLTLRGLTLVRGRSTFAGGGGITNDSDLTLTRCTLSGNFSGTSGGAIYSSGTLMLLQCTFSDNEAAEGGAVYNAGNATLTHCTLSGNEANFGGGINNRGTLTLGNTIVARNTAYSAPDFLQPVGLGNLTLAGMNLIGTRSESGLMASPTLLEGDPKLAPLGDYGGPNQTMALRPGSLARDAATGSTTTTDQRGFPMVGVSDIGAYEAGNVLSTNYPAFIWETLPATATASETAPTFDFDSDGSSNELEWLTLTQVTNPGSAFRLVVSRNGGDMVISFPTISGRFYRLQQSDTLLQNSWIDSGLPPKAGNNTVQNFTVTPASGPARRFFRVGVRAQVNQ